MPARRFLSVSVLRLQWKRLRFFQKRRLCDRWVSIIRTNVQMCIRDSPVTLSVEELMPILGIGRNTAYELVRSGRLRSIRVGRQVRIPRCV